MRYRKMRVITIMLLISLLLIIGCSNHPKGITEPRLLSGGEKAELVRTAFTTDEIKSVIERKEFYRVTIGWSMIEWRDNGTLYEININNKYDYEDYQEHFEEGLAAGKELFPAVIIDMGEPIDYQVIVSINPDTMKIADIQAHPLTPVTNKHIKD